VITRPPQGREVAIALRPIRPDDQPFLLGLYATTREQELAALPWDDAQKAAFVRMQFDAQHAYYQEHYADSAFDVVLVGDEPAGRLYVARWPKEIRIIDIAFAPAWRGRGLGTRLLTDLQREARGRRVPLTIHVERFNRALPLYERLGFTMTEDKGVYLFLEWRGDNSQALRPPRA
jgi:ribosomal protein S18 acetylase RimI-like enzyme